MAHLDLDQFFMHSKWDSLIEQVKNCQILVKYLLTFFNLMIIIDFYMKDSLTSFCHKHSNGTALARLTLFSPQSYPQFL
jgi:hypothetical protein